ncbi:outer membrane protein [Phenylobacterium sp.]|uniref:outer membrane protein n=1 Tax=Phenylobacterium sp. TaxID=1871053 RepID=UPI002734A35E|nr:outer membrane beta-barrel protein [Phenylobacterium sp.]MDP3661109.1 outer membrane beta-barrel protein [Phenylobacterium sp.]
MSRFTIAAASVAALSVLGAGTVAQAQAADWTGFYVGAHAGAASQSDNDGESILFDTNLDGNFNNTVNTAAGANAFSPGFCGGAAAASTPGAGCDGDDDGPEFGGRVGYDMQLGSFLVGAVAEASRTDVTDSVSAFSTTPAQYTMTRKLKGLAAIRARAGFILDRNLIYATGGAARGEIDHTFGSTNTANTFVLSGDDHADGYQWGGGLEHKLTDNVNLGVEYIYTKLDDGGARVRSQGPAPANNPFLLVNASGTDFQRSEQDFEVHSVRFTASYRF